MPQPSGRVVSSRYGQTEAETSPVSTVLRVWQERIFGTAYRQPAAMVLYVNENAVRHGASCQARAYVVQRRPIRAGRCIPWRRRRWRLRRCFARGGRKKYDIGSLSLGRP